jgi:uncharacterized protein (TIRG00374 family)
MDQRDKQQEIPLNLNDVSSSKKRSNWFRNIIGYLIALACLVWVFYDVHIGKLWNDIIHINWWLATLGIVFDILSYISQGIRWEFLIRPIGKVSWLKATQAVYTGLFTNEIIPMRFGELVRAYLISRWISKGFVTILPSMFVERLFDGIWLAIAAGITVILVPFPRDIVDSADILGVAVIVATALFVYVIIRKRKTLDRKINVKQPRWKLLGFINRFIEHLVRGLQDIGFSRSFYISFIISFFIPALEAIAFWLVIRAYGIPLSFWAGAIVFLIVHIGTAIPNAPANVGTYQFFCVVGLTLFGVEKTLATGFSLVVFIILTIPIWALGFFALSRSGTTLYEIKSQISRFINASKLPS